MIKLYKNDGSNKSFLLAQKFCHLRFSALARGYIQVQNHEKNLCKIRIQSSPSETYSKCSE